MYVNLVEDARSNSLKTRLVSDKIKWSSDNPEVLKVNKKGKIISGTKSGSVTISARAHNGVIGKIEINVVNYARPEKFSLYHGWIKEINSLLTDYKKEICDIAELERHISQITQQSQKKDSQISEAISQAEELGYIMARCTDH